MDGKVAERDARGIRENMAQLREGWSRVGGEINREGWVRV